MLRAQAKPQSIDCGFSFVSEWYTNSEWYDTRQCGLESLTNLDGQVRVPTSPSFTPTAQADPPAGAPSFPAPDKAGDPEPLAALDRALAELSAHKTQWAQLPISDLVQLLHTVRANYAAAGQAWVAACVQAKSIQDDRFAEGEEWVVFSMGLRALTYHLRSLRDIENTGRPRVPGGLRIDPSGRTVARVFPVEWTDRILFRGITADVWMRDGLTPTQVLENQAWAHRSASVGKLCVVLGAGNLSILPLLDTLDQMFVKRRVVALKTNPVSEYLNPVFETILEPLIEAGYLRILRGGAAQGMHLTRHPSVDCIHMTGSDKTFEKIVAADPASQVPAPFDKGISAELGNVTPLIVVPGPWSQDDLRHKATQLASWLAINAGFNCLSPRLIIQHAGWPLRQAFLSALEDVLARIPTRMAYYPGAADRQAYLVASHAGARQLGSPAPGHLPWTVIPNVDPEDPTQTAFRSEAFCPVLSETSLEAESTVEFIRRSVDFANQRAWGTLVVSLFVHPRSLANPEIRRAVQRAVADLRYGTVCVNLRGEYGYYPLGSPWGGAPGSPLDDIQSGLGVINNPFMFRDSVKSVVWGPFRQWPDPFSVTSSRLSRFGPALTDFVTRHSAGSFARVLWSAMFG